MESAVKQSRTAALCAALVLLAVSAGAAEAVFDLVAAATTKALPDGGSVEMWGFGLAADSPEITVPGPALDVPPGDSLRINLTNNLLVPVSIFIPGQAPPSVDGAPSQVVRRTDGRVQSFTLETPPGGSRSYLWSNPKPGTYLYHSGTHPAVQVQMGLYGAVSHDAAAGLAYPAVAYDQDVTLLYSEIDPAFHASVAAAAAGWGGPVVGDIPPLATVDYRPTYFLINGQPFDPAAPTPAAEVPVGQAVLLRLLNAGLETHVPALYGTRADLIAEDGNPYPSVRSATALPLAAGKTVDAVVVASQPGKVTILDRRLFLSSGPGGTGGMLAFLEVVP